jgi:ubiquinone/menaquinone biosynthesis C-methylase UbiE
MSAAPQENLPRKPLTTVLDDERPVPGISDAATLESHVARYRFAERWVGPQDKVLETACGVGYGAQRLARRVGSVLATDYSLLALQHARSHYAAENLGFAVMDCHRLAVGDGRFDVVVSFEVFEHLEQPAAYLAECHRVLRPGGRLLLSTPNRATWDIHMDSIAQDYGFHINMMGLEELRRVLRAFPLCQIYGQRRAGNWLYTALRAMDVWNLRLRLFPPQRRRQLQQSLGVGTGDDAAANSYVFSRWQLRQASHFFAVCRKAG